jgi:uncharacterized lipoprotein YbaY
MTWNVSAFALVVAPLLDVTGAAAQTIQGAASFRERIALPPASVFEAVLEDVSKADTSARKIAETRIDSPPTRPEH